MTTPAMTFDVGQLLDGDKLRNGPMTLFWNQDEFIPCNHKIDYGEPPKRKLIHRLLRVRAFRFDVRIAPPKDMAPAELSEWGKAIAARLDVPWQNEARDGDRAVWLPGWVWCKTAGQAVGSARHVFNKLDGLTIGQAQVRAIASERTQPAPASGQKDAPA